MFDQISIQKEIIDRHVSIFVERIKDLSRSDSRAVHGLKSYFPIFHPAKEDFFEYNYFECYLEGLIRVELATNTIIELLNNAGIGASKFNNPNKKNRLFAGSNSVDNQRLDEQDDFVFFFRINSSKVGIRYDSFCENVDEAFILRMLKKYKLDHIEIIDWSDTDSLISNKTIWGISENIRSYIYPVTLHCFFDKYFNKELYSIYKEKIRNAVKTANQIIGYQTVSNISPRFLSDLKESILKKLSNDTLLNDQLKKTKYRKFDKNGKMEDTYIQLLPDEDYELLDKRFIKLKLCRALTGNKEFAKCFITSEYLFEVFQSMDEKYFDYSTIVSGYFKSIELLLYTIMSIYLKRPDHDKLLIKLKKINIKNKKNIEKKDLYCVDRGKNRITPYIEVKSKENIHISFKEKYKDYFATEMGSLIFFIADNETGWNISEKGKKLVIECLTNYCQGCRNEHLHKDIIDDLKIVENIRNNTLLCLYYLLGGYDYSNDEDDDVGNLGIEDDSYERLFKQLKEIPRGQYKFIVQFKDKEELKTIRLIDQEIPTYNIEGYLKSSIRFVVVDDFDNFSFGDFIDENAEFISINRENMPEHLWLFNMNKRIPII